MNIQGITPTYQRKACMGTHQMQLQMIDGESHVVCMMCGYNFPATRSTPMSTLSSSKVTL